MLRAAQLPQHRVVSRRCPVFSRAEHTLVLKDGAIIDEGKLDASLLRWEKMWLLWHGVLLPDPRAVSTD